MTFDPDKYLAAKTQSSAFDPDAYLKAKGMAMPESAPSMLESALRGGAEGATFGLAPAIAGAAGAAPSALEALKGNLSLQDVKDAYEKSRAESKAKFDAAAKANPGSYLGGSLAGGLALAPLTGGLSEESAAAQGLARAVPLLSESTAAGALTGAGYGAAAGLGSSVSAGDDLSTGAKNVAAGAAGGSLVGGILSKLSGGLGSAADSLEETAAKRAVKATGTTKAQTKQLMNAPTASDDSMNRLLEHGDNLINSNPFQDTPVVTALAGPEEILSRVQDLKEKSGQAVGEALTQLDKNFDPSNENYFNPSDVVSQIRELQMGLTKDGVPRASTRSQYSALEDVIKDISQYGDQPVSFADADEIKQFVTDLAYNDNGKLTDSLMGQVRGIVNDNIEKAADAVAESSGDADLSGSYKTAKDYYRSAKDSENAITGKVAGNMSNRDLGITDYMSAIGGAAVHGGPGALVATGANLVGKKYGNQLYAAGSKNAANILKSVNNFFTTVAPEQLATWGSKLSAQPGQLEQNLGRVLTEASSRDDIGRNAVMFSLMQNPSYRSLMTHLVSHKEE